MPQEVIKVIRVYNQGESSTQRRAFENAGDEVSLNYPDATIIFEAKNITEVVNTGLTEDEFIFWLTEKDGCVCLCHPFQADFPPDWDYEYFLKQLRKVAEQKDIPIYPDPQDIENDPTFSQDKFGYIERLKDICIPSYKIKLNENKSDGSLTKIQKKKISAFAKANIEIRSNFYGGWVVKAPFSTDSKEIEYCDSIEEIYAAIVKLARKDTNFRVSYLILQPRLANRKEYKVCILSDPYTEEQLEPFLCVHPHEASDGRAFDNKYHHNEVFAFAKLAKRMYEEHVSPLTYPVFRIDIMRLQNGKMVVNEFESLEAMISSATLGNAKRAFEDSRSETFMQAFWESELSRILDSRPRKNRKLDS